MLGGGAGKTVERFPTIHLRESEVILHHLCDIYFLYGCESCVRISRHEKQNQRFCHLLLQDHAWDKTTRLHIHYIAIYSMTNPKPPVYYVRKRQLGFLGHILRLPVEEPTRICVFLCSTSRQEEAGSSKHLFHHVHPMGVRIS